MADSSDIFPLASSPLADRVAVHPSTSPGAGISESSPTGLTFDLSLADFWTIDPETARRYLIQATIDTHVWHYARNPAYRRTVEARGLSDNLTAADLPRLLRPTALTFKSYIDLLGTPFPQDVPLAFLEWVGEHLSIPLPRERFAQFRPRYSSLEALLADFERIYVDLGLEVSTSSGTSGRSTILVHSPNSMDRAAESFYLCFKRYLCMEFDHQAIFIMPRQTRVTMARMVGFSLGRVGIHQEQTRYTIPFPAYPDQIRIRAGRTFRPGWQGMLERRLLNPFMNWMNDRVATPRSARTTLDLLKRAERSGEKVIVFGSWIHLHAMALALCQEGRHIRLAPGSLLGTGGGLKELYPYTPAQIKADLAEWIHLTDGSPAPMRDVYGMAEGNWVAMQCGQGNYHIPPWVISGTLDENDRFQTGEDTIGLLAFFDPLGSGNLFPSFFKTADRVRLLSNGCPCSEAGAYIPTGSIQRVDLLDEAGCAAQV